MKRKFVPHLITAIAAVTLLVLGVASGSATTGKATVASAVPDIDYSKIGPNDSAIIVYVDPAIVSNANLVMNMELFKQECFLFVVEIEPGAIKSIEMTTLKPAKGMKSEKSCQLQIPNGTYTISVNASNPYNLYNFEIIPFTAAFDNVAVTYKIRPATNEEKTAAKIGLGNKVFTLEEVSQKTLR
jgi:hypothetical protein